MKTEQLKEWGLDDRQISMVMRENGRDIEAVKAKFSDYDMLKEKAAQLEQATALSEHVIIGKLCFYRLNITLSFIL